MLKSAKSDESATIRDSELYFLEETNAETWSFEGQKNKRYEQVSEESTSSG